jgi:hypothetical protein
VGESKRRPGLASLDADGDLGIRCARDEDCSEGEFHGAMVIRFRQAPALAVK